MKNQFNKLFALIAISATMACNNNAGKGNDTTDAGNQRPDAVHDGLEPRTPSPSMTSDSTGVDTNTEASEGTKDSTAKKVETATGKNNPATITNPK